MATGQAPKQRGLEGERSEREAEIAEKAKEFLEQAGGDPRRLAMIAAQYWHGGKVMSADGLYVESGVSHGGKPFVRLRLGEGMGQIDPEAARRSALILLEAAEVASIEAATISFAMSTGEGGVEMAARLVSMMRAFRRDRWGETDEEEETDDGRRPEAQDAAAREGAAEEGADPPAGAGPRGERTDGDPV